MDFITIKELAEKWNVSPRRIQMYCMNSEIPGAVKLGRDWLIPRDAVKPDDYRRKEFRMKREIVKIGNQGGFTLIEMLVVVAIIAILVSIAIPTVVNSTERTREITDLANVRSAYAVVKMAAMTENQSATYNGDSVYYKGKYSTTVELTQQISNWQIDEEELVIAGIDAINDKNTHWFDEPVAGGVCTVTYENGEVNLYWGGSAYDYISPLKKASKNGSRSYALNSTCSWNGTIQRVQSAIEDEGFLNDIKTWAAVKNTQKANDFNYVISTIDITDLEEGTKIPALYCDKDGNYSVGYTTVYKSPDSSIQGKSYNVISYDANGEYAYTYSGGKSSQNSNFDPSNMLTDSTEYSNLAAAQFAYQQLEKEYLANN